MSKAHMIIDLQFGSTGKGLLAGYLARTLQPDVVVTAWGPNAGHTYIDPDGRKFIHRMLANGVVSPKLTHVLIGPGSVIDPEILLAEIASCADLLRGKKIVIHPQAAIVLPEHLEAEKVNVKIGSTMKGTGQAVVQRINRDPDNMNVAWVAFPQGIVQKIIDLGVGVSFDTQDYNLVIDTAELIQIEGAQGFSLSIYHGMYPYTTSRDVTPAQVMADCAIPFDIKPEVYGTMRTYPIRVANRFDKNGIKIGTSGPGYADQFELDWEELGITPELTTVTKLPRRIFSFSYLQTVEACRMCSPDHIFLNFVNYLHHDRAREMVRDIELWTNKPVTFIGTGPADGHVLTDVSKKMWLTTGCPF